MRVWVTRTQPGADRQASELRAAGYRPVVEPVMQVLPAGVSPPAGPFQRAVFLSEHAVLLGWPALAAQPWFEAAELFAVGQRTAAVLEGHGGRATVPSDPTSEGLLALPGLQKLAGQRILLVSGVGGRTLLADELATRGAVVKRFECYRREALRDLDTRVLGCDAIIAASGDGLREVARTWFGAGGRVDVAVLVPSARVASLGVELGFRNIHDCAGADTRAWLAALAQLPSPGTS